jgi:hypothetical protein
VAGPVLITARSLGDDTVVIAVEELFAGAGSVVAVETDAVFETMVPSGVAGATRTTSVNCALALAARAAIVHVVVPVAPTAGFVHMKEGPLVWLSDTNVVPGGRTSVSVTVWASLGPPLATVIR